MIHYEANDFAHIHCACFLRHIQPHLLLSHLGSIWIRNSASKHRCGGATFDRVVANEHGIYVRMYVSEGKVEGLAIMKANILQTKYIAQLWNGITIDPLFIGDSVHIVVENVTQNMGTELSDAQVETDKTTIRINDGSDSKSYGTWTSTIVPENVTVELDCEVVEVNGKTITTKCDSEITWSESVFNRIPIWSSSGMYAFFGCDSPTNRAMFGGTIGFSKEGYTPEKWDKMIRYNVTTNDGTDLVLGDQLTIKDLPESFVSYWVNTIHAKALMGNYAYAMLVPPDV